MTIRKLSYCNFKSISFPWLLFLTPTKWNIRNSSKMTASLYWESEGTRPLAGMVPQTSFRAGQRAGRFVFNSVFTNRNGDGFAKVKISSFNIASPTEGPAKWEQICEFSKQFLKPAWDFTDIYISRACPVYFYPGFRRPLFASLEAFLLHCQNTHCYTD